MWFGQGTDVRYWQSNYISNNIIYNHYNKNNFDEIFIYWTGTFQITCGS